MTEGQLLAAGTQELLEPSTALLYIVPNPGSGCNQARDSKGNTNTVLDSGCLSISSIHLFLKKEIKENSLWLSFQLRLIKVLRAKESILLLPRFFFYAVENIMDLLCKVPVSHVMGGAECIFYSTIVTTLYHIAGKAQLNDHQFIP